MLKESVFIDTNAFVALIDTRDSRHQEATAISEDLLANYRKPHLTTDYVLDETYTFLRLRVGHKEAIKFGESIKEGKDIKVISLSQNLLDEAWELFKKYTDKEFSFTDCTSFVVMRKYGTTHAFSFDKHFSQAGFELVRAM